MNNDDELSEQQIKAVLSALEEAIAQGPWETSNFLRAIGKNLRDIHSNLTNQIDHSNEPALKIKEINERLTPKQGQQEVFISLYSSEGSNIQAWERILTNLPRQMISRPIYEQEEDVKYLIKAKENKINEAYVSIFVDRSHILSIAPDKTPLDKFGKPLLTLKDRSLDLNHVHYFIHFSGTYRYSRGRLIKVDIIE